MFEGSAHVPEGEFDNLLEAAGGTNNGSTNVGPHELLDRRAVDPLELALFLESDRMGDLLEAMSPERVNGQRDVVKNERRQTYEKRRRDGVDRDRPDDLPGRASVPWPTIGYMEDLTPPATRTSSSSSEYYAPSNASLVVAGDSSR